MGFLKEVEKEFTNPNNHKKPIGILSGRGNSKSIQSQEQADQFLKDRLQKIEQLGDVGASIVVGLEILSKKVKPIAEAIEFTIDNLIAAGFTVEEIIKLIKNSEKSSPILLKTIVLKKSSKKPYKQRRYKRFQNHR